MQYLRRIILLIFFISLVITSPTAYAQDDIPGTGIGISASYQKEHFGIQLPFWLSETMTLAPNFAMYYKEGAGTELQIGFLPKFFLSKKKVSPYIGFLAGVIIAMPEEEDSVTDIVLGISVGAEYFITRHFSVSIDAQLNGTISDDNSNRFGNPGKLNLNTGTGFTGTIYF